MKAWAALCGTVLFIAGAGAAHAQATRTWVSGVGDDANPCSRTAPCKTFAGAISKTLAGGIIDCLDPGGFGAVTITKAITIDCTATLGSVLVSGTNAINVITNPADIVVLRNLDIVGIGSGLTGVNFIQSGTLHIQNSRIYGFRSLGVNFVPSGSGELNISNSSIHDNGTNSSGGGIQVRPTGTAFTRVAIKDTSINNNFVGLLADGGGGTGGMNVAMNESSASNNRGFGIFATTATAGVGIMVDRTVIANNGNLPGSGGIVASGGTTVVRVGGSTITGNIVGVNASGGATLVSYMTNQINGNFGGETVNTIPLK